MPLCILARMPTNLREWIAHLEDAEMAEPENRDLLRQLRESVPDGDFYHASSSDPKPVRDYVSHRLNVLWNDLGVWRLVHSNADPLSIQGYVQRSHDLFLPPFSYSIYLEMVGNRTDRHRLFNLLRARPSTFGGATIPQEAKDAINELNARGAGDLLLDYIGRGTLSRRSRLRWLQLSDTTFKEIGAAIARLKKDIDWCLANPTADKPGPALFTKRGQFTSPDQVALIDKMVEIVNVHGLETCDAITKSYSEAKGLSPDEYESQRRSLLGAASYAKHLAELRDGTLVKHHVDEKGIGRKPRRRNI